MFAQKGLVHIQRGEFGRSGKEEIEFYVKCRNDTHTISVKGILSGDCFPQYEFSKAYSNFMYSETIITCLQTVCS